MKYNLTIRPPKCYWPKKKGVSQNGQIPNVIGICSYWVLDRPVFEWNQVLLYPELTPWWSFLFADGAHKRPHSPNHPNATGWTLGFTNSHTDVIGIPCIWSEVQEISSRFLFTFFFFFFFTNLVISQVINSRLIYKYIKLSFLCFMPWCCKCTSKMYPHHLLIYWALWY